MNELIDISTLYKIKQMFPNATDSEIVNTLKDMFHEYVKQQVSSGGLSKDDMQEYAYYMSEYLSDIAFKDISTDAQSAFEDSVADAYGEHAKNFAYTYKPEATEIDSSIDPNEQHIGIMAQDIEQINPACIKETEDGVKTVDTGRLALMNAGAIGDIARRLKQLEEKVL